MTGVLGVFFSSVSEPLQRVTRSLFKKILSIYNYKIM